MLKVREIMKCIRSYDTNNNPIIKYKIFKPVILDIWISLHG